MFIFQVNVNKNKTKILDKVVLFFCLLLSSNPYLDERVLLTPANECLNSGFLFQGVIFYIYLVSLSWWLWIEEEVVYDWLPLFFVCPCTIAKWPLPSSSATL